LKTVKKNLYEGMFLVDSALAASDWDEITNKIANFLERSGAKIESLGKWDERKLAYKIKGKSHGTYILAYFRVEGPKIKDIEKDIQLSEDIMRVLILKTDKMSQEDLKKDTPIMREEKKKRKAQEKAAAKAEEQNELTSPQQEQENADEKQMPQLEESEQIQNPEVPENKETPDDKQKEEITIDEDFAENENDNQKESPDKIAQ